jgi:hypothetical protein
MNTAERTQVNAHIDMDVRDELALLAECNRDAFKPAR